MTRDVPGVGIVGLGFMGRTHFAAYRAAAAAGHANRIVAVCDHDAGRRAGEVSSSGNIAVDGSSDARLFEAGEVSAYADPAALFADAAVDVVSICTPTDSHVHLAAAALSAGKHVLVEKPLALSSASVVRLLEAERASGRIAMPAMCVRFWPGWDLLPALARDGTHGALRSVVFRRHGTRPAWGEGFYDDPARSGGALFDLHVHDADLVRALCGRPASVSCTGSLDHVTTSYRFSDGPAHVVAEGGWDHTPGLPFRMAYTVVFERATLDYDSTRASPLRLAADGRCEDVVLEAHTGYDGEVRHLLDVLARGATPSVTLADAYELVRLLEAESASLVSGRSEVVPG